MFLLRAKLRWKTGNMDKNLQRNSVAGQVEGFCIPYFAAFRDKGSCGLGLVVGLDSGILSVSVVSPLSAWSVSLQSHRLLIESLSSSSKEWSLSCGLLVGGAFNNAASVYKRGTTKVFVLSIQSSRVCWHRHATVNLEHAGGYMAVHLWLRAETKPNERRTHHTPEKCKELVKADKPD